MKRVFLIVFLAVLVFSSSVIAAETTIPEGSANISDSNQAAINPIKINPNALVEQEIEISPSMQVLATLVLGIKDKTVTISKLTVIALLWTLVFMFLMKIVTLVPMIEGKIVPTLIALIITFLIALSGVLENISVFILNTGKSLKFIENQSAGFLAFIVTAGIVLFIVGKKALDWAEEYAELHKARLAGFKEAKILAREKIKQDITDSV